MSKRSKSLVTAFSLVPVVEQILPDRQKIEVAPLYYHLWISILYYRWDAYVCGNIACMSGRNAD